MILRAVAGPTPSSSPSSASVAEFRLTGVVGTPGPAPPPTSGAAAAPLGRLDRHDDLPSVGDLRREVQRVEVRAAARPAGPPDGVLHARARGHGDEARVADRARDVDDGPSARGPPHPHARRRRPRAARRRPAGRSRRPRPPRSEHDDEQPGEGRRGRAAGGPDRAWSDRRSPRVTAQHVSAPDP